MLVLKLIQGFLANQAYERKYSNWRIDPEGVESGRSWRNTILGAILMGAIGPLTVYKFTINSSLTLLDSFPERRISEFILGKDNGTLFSRLASWMDNHIERAAVVGGDFFDGIVTIVRVVLDTLTLALNGTPWPVAFSRQLGLPYLEVHGRLCVPCVFGLPLGELPIEPPLSRSISHSCRRAAAGNGFVSLARDP